MTHHISSSIQAFSYKQVLAKHIKAHSDEHKCHICEKVMEY